MKVITGAGGHVGNTLARMLCERKEKVRAMVHFSDTPRAFENLNAEKVEGDVTDYDSLLKAFKGAETVYHCAAFIALEPRLHPKLHAVNVTGTENVIRACRETGVKKLVYVSSVEAIGNAAPGGILDESYGFDPANALITYGVTKAEGARRVLEAVEKEEVEAVILCPVAILGPNDYRPSKFGRMFMDFISRKLPAYPEGGFDFVDVRDVAEALISAENKGRNGESYLLSSEHLRTDELMKLLEKITNIKKPYFKLPTNMMKMVAFFFEKFSRVSGSDPIVTREAVHILQSNMKTSNAKARKELGFDPRPVAQTISDHISWLREHHTFKKK